MLRYCTVPTEKKPVVDLRPLLDNIDGKERDIFRLSQEHWSVKGARRNHEERHLVASMNGRKEKVTVSHIIAQILHYDLQCDDDIIAWGKHHGKPPRYLLL